MPSNPRVGPGLALVAGNGIIVGAGFNSLGAVWLGLPVEAASAVLLLLFGAQKVADRVR